MTDDVHDPLMSLLARLPQAAPSAARADLVRARSRVALEQTFQKQAAREAPKASGRAVDAALLLACVVYMAAAAIGAFKSGWPR